MFVESLINGIVVAIVESLEDPEQLGRLRVTYPVLGDQRSAWAKQVCLMAGADRGTLFRPEIGDEVLVAFEMGRPERPYVLGALWNKTDLPPDMGESPTENNWRLIKSRSGHIFRFDDSDGAEKVEIRDKDDLRRIIVDTAGKTILVTSEGGDGVIRIDAPEGRVEVEAGKGIAVTCHEGDVAVAANGGGKVSVESASSNIEIKATGGTVQVDAKTISMNATSSLALKAGSGMSIEAGGALSIKGSVVNIN